jgi:hypothetical protein
MESRRINNSTALPSAGLPQAGRQASSFWYFWMKPKTRNEVPIKKAMKAVTLIALKNRKNLILT